jgi:hypothetical protein
MYLFPLPPSRETRTAERVTASDDKLGSQKDIIAAEMVLVTGFFAGWMDLLTWHSKCFAPTPPKHEVQWWRE